MAVSNQEVAAWLAANPMASDAEIAQAALDAGVSSQQLAQVTGIPVEQIETRIKDVLPTINPSFELRTVEYGDTSTPTYFVAGTNIPVQASTVEGIQGSTGENKYGVFDSGRQGYNTFDNSGGFTGFLNARSTWDSLKPVVMGVAGGALGSYLQGAGAVGAGVTDAGFLAADAAQLAAQGLSEAQIATTLGSYGSTAAANLAASMAVNGLDVGMMTQQLDALSTNTGLMSQTGSAADFAAADALQLQSQVGNNFAAIEQNLIASGVDPLVAADISQQIAFNPGLTQADLATNLSNSFGNNIYDVNMATTYPTSVLPGAGGLLSDVPGAAATGGGGGVSTTTGANITTGGSGAGATAGTGLTGSQIGNLVKAGVGLLGTGAAVSAVGGGNNMPMQTPTQGIPTNSPEYYQQLQQYYNAYLPQTPRDVVSPLQQWYNSKSGA